MGIRLEERIVDSETGQPFDEARFELPFETHEFTDFYASIHHATRVGRLLRPENPLLPNYCWVPVAYGGRASSLIPSGVPVQRPYGQLGEGRFGPTEQLDFELELGVYIARDTSGPVPVSEAADYIAGFCIVNDWSARDIQRWEYQPLGPFLGKSFATSVSPWVVPPGLLKAHRVPAPERPETTLPYLRPPGWLYDIAMEARVNGELRCRTNAVHLYWTFEQMIAHHTSNGCKLRRGDLLASGTVSGPEDTQRACLLESQGPYLSDGDEVVLTAYTSTVSFGECRAVIAAAR